ncbi:unnamed protein product [marine sediment metagenome]|uniref:Uncharacterized protein n=1 Tax=marine sediment metagenome TaxID=412755 RepID=X1CW80_9ZZZZ
MEKKRMRTGVCVVMLQFRCDNPKYRDTGRFWTRLRNGWMWVD